MIPLTALHCILLHSCTFSRRKSIRNHATQTYETSLNCMPSPILYCVRLYCIPIHYTVLYCTTLLYTALHYTTLHRCHHRRHYSVMTGHPIVGDVRYGAPQSFKSRDIALHAHSLAFPHPISAETVRTV